MSRKRKGTGLVSQQKRLLGQLETLSKAVAEMEAGMERETLRKPAAKAKGMKDSITARLTSLKESFKARGMRSKRRGGGLFSRRNG